MRLAPTRLRAAAPTPATSPSPSTATSPSTLTSTSTSLSAPGAWGALRLALWTARRGLARDRLAVMRRQHDSLGAAEEGPTAVLNVALERTDGAPLRIEIRDSAGSHGVLDVDGARLSHVQAPRGGSADLIAYFARQASEVLRLQVSVVIWGQIDDDEAVRYLAQVQFARNLAR